MGFDTPKDSLISLSMYCPDELKLNKFKHVRIPSNDQYFARYGGVSPEDSGNYTGDEAIPMAQTKIDAIAEGAQLYEQYAREASQR